jgi:hypothetical protein
MPRAIYFQTSASQEAVQAYSQDAPRVGVAHRARHNVLAPDRAHHHGVHTDVGRDHAHGAADSSHLGVVRALHHAFRA